MFVIHQALKMFFFNQIIKSNNNFVNIFCKTLRLQVFSFYLYFVALLRNQLQHKWFAQLKGESTIALFGQPTSFLIVPIVADNLNICKKIFFRKINRIYLMINYKHNGNRCENINILIKEQIEFMKIFC